MWVFFAPPIFFLCIKRPNRSRSVITFHQIAALWTHSRLLSAQLIDIVSGIFVFYYFLIYNDCMYTLQLVWCVTSTMHQIVVCCYWLFMPHWTRHVFIIVSLQYQENTSVDFPFEWLHQEGRLVRVLKERTWEGLAQIFFVRNYRESYRAL